MGNLLQSSVPNIHNRQHNQSVLSADQVSRLQRLFSRGLRPDLSLLPYQMRRMRNDAPPKATQNRRTIRMRNLCFIEKNSFALKHLQDKKYILQFKYSSTIAVYCSIYFFANEITDDNKCPLQFIEKDNISIIDENQERSHLRQRHMCYTLPIGHGLHFEQSVNDFLDLNVNSKFYESIPSLAYYPIIIVFNKSDPSLMTNVDEKEMDDQFVTRVITYAKLVLKDDGMYTASIVSQKTQVSNRTFVAQEIYGLLNDNRHRNTGNMKESKESEDEEEETENACVVCLTMARDTALCPCRHLCMCGECAQELLKRSNKCPICRAFVVETIYISPLKKLEQ